MNQTENALALAESIGGKNRLNCIAELDETAAEQAKAQEADKQDRLLAGKPLHALRLRLSIMTLS